MGKGDKRTRRGKIFAGSFGKARAKGKKNSGESAKQADTKKEEQVISDIINNWNYKEKKAKMFWSGNDTNRGKCKSPAFCIKQVRIKGN